MVGQKVVSETGPRRFTQNSDFGLIETDVEGHRCVMNRLLFGVAVARISSARLSISTIVASTIIAVLSFRKGGGYARRSPR